MDTTVLNTNSADDLPTMVEKRNSARGDGGASAAIRVNSQNYASATAYDGPTHMILNEQTAISSSQGDTSEPSKKFA